MSLISLKKKNEYAIVKLNRGRANPINHEMVNELRTVINRIEKDENLKGIILTGQPNFFSVGLDVIELYELNENQIKIFFKDLGDLFLELITFQKIHITAINGYAPAGGTLLAITSDYRIMANDAKFTIGLNEVSVGVPPTQRIIDTYSFVLGTGIASKLTLQGSLLSPEEAYKYGLIDKLCDTNNVLICAEKKMKEMLLGDYKVYRFAKKKLRSELINKLNYNTKKEINEINKLWWDPIIRKRIKKLVNKLKK